MELSARPELLKEVFVLRKAKLEEYIHDLISTEIIISNSDIVSISCPFAKFPIQTNQYYLYLKR